MAILTPQRLMQKLDVSISTARRYYKDLKEHFKHAKVLTDAHYKAYFEDTTHSE